MNHFRFKICSLLVSFALPAVAFADTPFVIRIVDEETGRGVPLVELETVNHLQFVTDNAGVIAIDDTELLGRNTYFHIRSHGYEYPKSKFGYRGKALKIEGGKQVELKLKRLNIAERLYRITGAGRYTQSIKAGLLTATTHPLINSKVLGSDSAHVSIYRGELFWIWGDTKRLAYPLGNFHVSAATSPWPGDPESSIELDYFQDEHGFTKKMAELPGDGPTWLGGLVTLRDANNRERLVATYVKVKPPLTIYERGLCEFDAREEKFQKILTIPKDANCSLLAIHFGIRIPLESAGSILDLAYQRCELLTLTKAG